MDSGLVGLEESIAESIESKIDEFLNAERGELGTEEGAIEEEFWDDCTDHLLGRICGGGIVTEVCDKIASADDGVEDLVVIGSVGEMGIRKPDGCEKFLLVLLRFLGRRVADTVAALALVWG